MMSAREKIRRLVDRCDTCLAKERSIKAKRGPQLPSIVGNMGEKVFIDLVSMSETVRKNCFFIKGTGWIHKNCYFLSHLQ